MTERKPADERTADLLAAAERILERRQRVTVSEVAREAGIASGTFYLYFPSKAHLEATLVERFIDGYVQRVESAVDGDQDVLTRLDAAIDAMVAFAIENRAVFQLQVEQQPTEDSRAVLSRAVSRIRSLLLDAVLAGVARGEFDAPDPQMTVSVLYHGIEGVLRHALTFDEPVDPERLASTAREVAHRVLAPQRVTAAP